MFINQFHIILRTNSCGPREEDTFDFFSIISFSFFSDATYQLENNPADPKPSIHTSGYQADNGYGADNGMSGLGASTNFGASPGNSSALVSQAADKASDTSYFLLDNLSRHLGRPTDEQINSGYSKDQAPGKHNLASKECSSKARDSQVRQIKNRIGSPGLQTVGQSVLQNKMLNEQSVKSQTKTGYSAKAKGLDGQLESVKMFGQRLEQSSENGQQILRENQPELKSVLEQSGDYAQENQEEDNNFQTIYGVQAPLMQSTLEAMDIYYPTDVLYSNLQLNLKESPRHLDAAGYGHQSIEKQFYSSAKSPAMIAMSEEPSSVYHYADSSLVGPGVNGCDDYVVTFLWFLFLFLLSNFIPLSNKTRSIRRAVFLLPAAFLEVLER